MAYTRKRPTGGYGGNTFPPKKSDVEGELERVGYKLKVARVEDKRYYKAVKDGEELELTYELKGEPTNWRDVWYFMMKAVPEVTPWPY